MACFSFPPPKIVQYRNARYTNINRRFHFLGICRVSHRVNAEYLVLRAEHDRSDAFLPAKNFLKEAHVFLLTNSVYLSRYQADVNQERLRDR